MPSSIHSGVSVTEMNRSARNILIPLRSGVRIGATSSIMISLTSQDAARFVSPLTLATWPFDCNSTQHHNKTVSLSVNSLIATSPKHGGIMVRGLTSGSLAAM